MSVVNLKLWRKRKDLEMVRDELGDCQRCSLHETRDKIAFGVGDLDARLLVIGEAPGEEENRSGEPFVGEAGQILSKVLQAMGLRREEVYLCDLIKCRPPGRRRPKQHEIARCGAFLLKQIEIVKPEVILCLGDVATEQLLGAPLEDLRGLWREHHGWLLMATYHPERLRRDPHVKRLFWEDIRAVMDRLGLDPDASS